MTRKIVTITFVVDNDMTADRLAYNLSEHGCLTYNDETAEGYDHHFQDLGYGSASISVFEPPED